MGWEDWAWELEAWEVEAVVWGIVSSIQDFYQTVGGRLAIQVENNNPKQNPTPGAKDTKHNPKNYYNLLRQIAVRQNSE